MANVVATVGQMNVLNSVRNALNCITRLHLYASPHTPAIGDTDATYAAIEANFSGYSPQPLGAWNPAYVNASTIAEIDAAQQTFVQNGGPQVNTIYGAFVTDDAGHLCYAEQFDAPVLMNTLGATLRYTPRMTCQSA